MTTPLEAQELAKRLRDAKVSYAQWQNNIHDDGPSGAARCIHLFAVIDAAAAFLEHPVNIGQGVTEEPIAWLDLRSEPADGWTKRVVATNPEFVANNGPENFAPLVRAARTPLASVEGVLDALRQHHEQALAMMDDEYLHSPLYAETVEALSVKAHDAPTKTLMDNVRIVHDTFKRDLEQGYRTRDKTFAVELLGAALAQSGRSSAEPVVKPFAGARAVVREAREEADRKFSDSSTLAQALNTLSPPVGPQEAVAVKATTGTVRKELYDKLLNCEPAADHLRRERKIDRKEALGLVSFAFNELSDPSGIDLGGEVERLTQEIHDLQARFDLELDAYAKDSDMAALRASLSTAEKALRPFAKAYKGVVTNEFGDDESRSIAYSSARFNISVADLRIAREALASLSTNAVREGE